MLAASFDEGLGIIRTVCKGYTPPEEQQAYIAQKALLNSRARMRMGRVLHLVDTTEGVIHSKFAADRLTARMGRTDSAGDRTAILVKAQLTEMRMQAPPGKGEIRFFVDMDQAVAWLLSAQGIAKAS